MTNSNDHYELGYGSAESETPTRAWHDSDGKLIIGPLKTTHNMHYAQILPDGTLKFVRSRADTPEETALTPLVNLNEILSDPYCRCPVCGYKAPCAMKCDVIQRSKG